MFSETKRKCSIVTGYILLLTARKNVVAFTRIHTKSDVSIFSSARFTRKEILAIKTAKFHTSKSGYQSMSSLVN